MHGTPPIEPVEILCDMVREADPTNDDTNFN